MRERVATIEANMKVHGIQMSDTVSQIRLTNEKLDKIAEILAENRGGQKAAKFIWSVVVSVLGFLGGVLGSIVKHA